MHQIILTNDGSYTLLQTELQEHYHSINGACTESKHVFIQAGLEKLLVQNKSTIQIFEVGFGTGLNAMLTFEKMQHQQIQIQYKALEPFPLPEEILYKINFDACLETISTSDWLNKIQNRDQGQPSIIIDSHFTLEIIKCKLEAFQFLSSIDLIYFDAFGPQIQPEIWSEENFSKLFKALSKDGILVTYCAKGSVRRLLQQVGFQVERLPGPPGKREMLRATKTKET